MKINMRSKNPPPFKTGDVLVRRAADGGLEKRPNKVLANRSSGTKIAKKAHAGRGPETTWEILVDTCGVGRVSEKDW